MTKQVLELFDIFLGIAELRMLQLKYFLKVWNQLYVFCRDVFKSLTEFNFSEQNRVGLIN